MKKTEEKAKTGLWRIIKTRPEHKKKGCDLLSHIITHAAASKLKSLSRCRN
jgi:hypothetical protein